MNTCTMSSHERVAAAIAGQAPDRIPRDFAAVPEIWQALQERLGCDDRLAVLEALKVDCRMVSYDSFCRHPDDGAVDMAASQERSSVGGMWRCVLPDGSNRDIWGAHRKRVVTAQGTYDEFASHPLAGVEGVATVEAHAWPEPSWWDFSTLPAAIEALDAQGDKHIRFRVGSVWECAWSLVGFEAFQLLLYDEPAVVEAVLARIAAIHAANLEAALAAAGQRIDMVYIYDDLATQLDLLISPESYDHFVRPHHQRLIDIAHAHAKPFMLHCCGAVRRLLPRLIEMGLDVLNPIQTSAAGMEPEGLKRDFGNQLCFHGGIDVQQFLPTASPDQVRAETERMSALFADGGWIMAGSHHIQADTPVDNVLAMYGLDGRAPARP